jgi:type II secretory pathway pseudopilin PulG
MKRKNGMTLIPLILTIIILIIVSTVAIKISIDQGIFDIAKKSASEYNTSKDLEQIRLAYSLYHTEKDNLDTNQVVFDKIKNSLDFEGATYTIASQYMNIVKNTFTHCVIYYHTFSKGAVKKSRI